jgi:hypothetical protein
MLYAHGTSSHTRSPLVAMLIITAALAVAALQDRKASLT